MKNIKRIFAALLCMAISLSFAGCHKKDEIAVSVKDVEFTSAYYMCALINAYSEGQSEVRTALGDKATADLDFFKQKES